MAGTGQIITVNYNGGSRPGEPRQFVVVSCSQNDIRGIEPGTRKIKQYKISKIIWLEDGNGLRVNGKPQEVHGAKEQLPIFETLKEYANYLGPKLRAEGWYIHEDDESFGVGTFFKNGKPKKTPSIAVCFVDRSTELVWDLEANDLVEIKKELTGRERPWRVDSHHFGAGKAFGRLHSAIECFMAEAKASNPEEAKGMFAGHDPNARQAIA